MSDWRNLFDRRMVRVSTFLMILLAAPNHRVCAQEHIDELQILRSALADGDVRRLMSLTPGSLELALFGPSQQYSHVQAELVLKQFFKENRPRSFDIVDYKQSKRGLFVEGRLRLSDEDRPIRTYLRLNRTAKGWKLRELLMERSDR